MAITKMMHMKEDPKYTPQHLINAINYVLDVKHLGKKTDFGKWVGGNVGLHSQEIIQAFLDTKRFWGKEDGRQGYHFVLSFGEDENVDEQTCYNILSEFCEKYLGDSFDYMFAVHTDKEHMHGHIIFNSLNRETGYKYHYKQGDWEKYIQPVTDEICKNYGLKELTYKKERVGVSYASWNAKKNGKVNWHHIMRADIDWAIEQATDIEEFFSIMKEMNYVLEMDGISDARHSEYITYIYTDDKGKEHKRRSHHMIWGRPKDAPDEYCYSAIAKKIKDKSLCSEPYYEELSGILQQHVNVRLGATAAVLHGTKTYRRMYQAVSYYKLPNPFAVPQQQVRRDMLRIEKLIEECAYLKTRPSVTVQSLNNRAMNLDALLKELYIERKTLHKIEEDMRITVETDVLYRYRQLLQMISEAGERGVPAEVEDELEDIEETLPHAFVTNEKKLHRCERNIKLLEKEKRVLCRVIQTEGGETKALKKELHIAPGHKI